MRAMYLNAYAILTTLIFLSPIIAAAFDPRQCEATILGLILNGTIHTHGAYLWENGEAIGQRRNISAVEATYYLKLGACEAFCGPGWSFYDAKTIMQRLFTWIVPILLLLGNMALADFGTRGTILTMIHTLGDPIDSFWSLLTTLELRRRAVHWAYAQRHWAHRSARAVGEVISVLDELSVPDPFSSLAAFARHERFLRATLVAAQDIADFRTHETRRTWFAVLFYLLTISAAFLNALKWEDEKPGNRVAFALLFSWLIALIILGSRAGKAASRRGYPRIMARLWRTVGAQGSPMLVVEGNRKLWGGEVYTFRRHKRLFASGHPGDFYRSPPTLFGLSFVMVLIPGLAAFLLSWITPEKGMKCKTLSILLISLGWVVSALFTAVSWRLCSATQQCVWSPRIILAKDAVICVAIVINIILANIGTYHTCFCNSATFSRGIRWAGLELDANYKKAHYLTSLYPALTLANMAWLLVMTGVCVWLTGVQGLRSAKKDAVVEKREDGKCLRKS